LGQGHGEVKKPEERVRDLGRNGVWGDHGVVVRDAIAEVKELREVGEHDFAAEGEAVDAKKLLLDPCVHVVLHRRLGLHKHLRIPLDEELKDPVRLNRGREDRGKEGG